MLLVSDLSRYDWCQPIAHVQGFKKATRLGLDPVAPLGFFSRYGATAPDLQSHSLLVEVKCNLSERDWLSIPQPQAAPP